MPTISVDFETLYDTKGGYGIKELGVAAYVRHERFDPYLISVSDGTQTWAGQPKNFNFDSLNGATLISHNAQFDSLVLAEMTKRGLAPKVDFKEWHCSANLSVYLCGRRSLAAAAEFLLGVRADKSVREKADGKTWADLTKEDGGVSMLEYARSDALLCWQLWNKFGHLWPEWERKLSALTIKQCQRGCQIDTANLDRQRVVAHTALKQAELALPWIAEGKPPTSPKAVCEMCRKEGIECPPVKSHPGGEEAYEIWEARYAPRFSWAKAYTDFRVINKYISTLETIKTRISEDGILSYDLLYGGAHTMRWAGSGGFNMQNMRKSPLLIDGDGRLVTDGLRLKEFEDSKVAPGWLAQSLCVRSLFIPSSGKRMMTSDLSQIEPRVLSWIAGDQEMLDLMATGHSPYFSHAVSTMGWDSEKDLTANKTLYALCKSRVIGAGYGVGWKRFIEMAKIIANLDVTVDDPEFTPSLDKEGRTILDKDGNPVLVSGYGFNSKRIIKEYRESNPLVTALWKKLDEDFRASVGGNFEIELPSGRKLRYPNVKREMKLVADPDDESKVTRKWATTCETFDSRRGGVIRKALWGGHFTENICQAVARDIFSEAMLALEDTPGIEVLFHAHDEVILQTDPEVTEEQITKIMSRTPAWIPGLPVACKTSTVPHYTK